MNYLAHVSKNGETQTLENHLFEVSHISSHLSGKIGCETAGQIIGLFHDFGKYSLLFQNYLRSATGILNQSNEEYVQFEKLKGKIDHSSAGGQIVWEEFNKWGKHGQLVGQILSLCIFSHHTGLIDCLKLDGTNGFIERTSKNENDTCKTEAIKNALSFYNQQINLLINEPSLKKIIGQIIKVTQTGNNALPEQIRFFNLGFLTRFLFSCLVDADRINSADFETPGNKHNISTEVNWDEAINRMETALSNFEITKPIDSIRRKISETCKLRAIEMQGIYTLTVPTGGGKTFASLRYALHHAKQHKLERIFYIIPYTSIIEQNAQAIRSLIESEIDRAPWVLEHHSNLEPEQQTEHSKLVAENWDSPIVITTMVQFLEVLFSGGTRGVRKLHQLARSVIIFDEIQTLPISCVHLFCNSLNFLTTHSQTTVVLCTATQPLLNELKKSEKGQLNIPSQNELIGDLPKLFEELKRVNVSNKVRAEGWSVEQIAELACEEMKIKGSCLIIVNTKEWAKKLYQTLKSHVSNNFAIYMLSTDLCPAHRKYILSEIKDRLHAENKSPLSSPVLCISTQLIEAGVDVDFAAVIRFLAGLDSIAQAAGRCNRNGLRETATVHVINPEKENIDFLKEIKIGKEKSLRVVDENFQDLLSPVAIKRYFQYYFFDRSDEMDYPVKNERKGLDDNLLNLLSDNNRNVGKYDKSIILKQSFMTAGEHFQAIDSPTKAVIVPYNDEAKDIITRLCRVAKEFDIATYRYLLKQAQKYSVNVFPNVWLRLCTNKCIHEIQPEEGIFYLDEQFYSLEFGISEELCNEMCVAII